MGTYSAELGECLLHTLLPLLLRSLEQKGKLLGHFGIQVKKGYYEETWTPQICASFLAYSSSAVPNNDLS
jgi:hypothetical protein